MPRLSDLLSTVIPALTSAGLEEKSIKETARRLRETGHIKSGVGGRYGGADVDEHDSAALMFPFVGAGDRRDVIKAGETVDLVAGLRLQGFRDESGGEISRPSRDLMFGLPDDHTFGQAVAAVIAHVRDWDWVFPLPFRIYGYLVISVERPWPRARLTVGAEGHLYTAIYSSEAVAAENRAVLEAGGGPDKWAERNRALDARFGGRSGAYTIRREVETSLIRAFAEGLGGCGLRLKDAEYDDAGAPLDPDHPWSKTAAAPALIDFSKQEAR